MTPSNNRDEFGFELFDDSIEKPEDSKQEKGFLRKVGEAALGPLGSEEGRRHVSRTGARVAETGIQIHVLSTEDRGEPGGWAGAGHRYVTKYG